jgi:hypothetical protein
MRQQYGRRRTKMSKTYRPRVLRVLLAGVVLALVSLMFFVPAARATHIDELVDHTVSARNASQIHMSTGGPDPASPYPSKIKISGMDPTATIQDLNVKLWGFSHIYQDDVDVLLAGPAGQKVILMSDVGGGYDTDYFEVKEDLVLDDEAAGYLPDGTWITAGTYRPTDGTSVEGAACQRPANFPSPAPASPYARTLSSFDDTNPNGVWKLFVLDDCGPQSRYDLGEFAGGWSLVMTYSDTEEPSVTSTAPGAGATGVDPAAKVTATFSERMKTSTMNGTTFKLFGEGSAAQVGASVSYRATADKAILKPTNPLRRGVTYKAVVTTSAKDLAGNSLDQDGSLSGLQPKVWYFKVRN